MGAKADKPQAGETAPDPKVLDESVSDLAYLRSRMKATLEDEDEDDGDVSDEMDEDDDSDVEDDEIPQPGRCDSLALSQIYGVAHINHTGFNLRGG